MENKPIALCVNEKDNVATVFANGLEQGTVITVINKSGSSTELELNHEIPYGHKVAVKPIHKDELIIKYGEEIGVATKEIAAGDYVHVHNLDSMRGRGDWEKE